MFKDIAGFEGLYGITSCGRVWSYRSKKFLKPFINNRGYYMCELCRNGERKKYLIHRLVAEAYLPNLENLPQVNHIDEDKSHNYIRNLEWCDAKYNNNYGTRNERAAKKISEKRKIKVLCVETGVVYPSMQEASEAMGLNKSTLSMYFKRGSKTCAGYTWKKIEDGGEQNEL